MPLTNRYWNRTRRSAGAIFNCTFATIPEPIVYVHPIMTITHTPAYRTSLQRSSQRVARQILLLYGA